MLNSLEETAASIATRTASAAMASQRPSHSGERIMRRRAAPDPALEPPSIDLSFPYRPDWPTHAQRTPLEQCPGVAGRVRHPVVVEVGEDLTPRPPGGYPTAPALQLGRRVVAASPPGSEVKPGVGPVSGRLRKRQRAPRVISHDRRRVVVAQERVDGRREPAHVAELEAVAPGRKLA